MGDALKNVPLREPETVGRHSLLEQLALAAEQVWKREDAAGRPRSSVAELLGLENEEETLALAYSYRLGLRPVQQLPAGAWLSWFYCGGRGAGKTHAGACAVISEARADPEAKILIVGPTNTKILKELINGPSGIITLSPPDFRPELLISKKMLQWPNGAVAHWIPAEDPEKFRGPQFTFMWLDELVGWKPTVALEVLKQCFETRRLRTARMEREGLEARAVITTTPNRHPVIRALLEDFRDGLVASRSRTVDNGFLDPGYLRMARARLSNPANTEASRELGGVLDLDDFDAAIYSKVDWNRTRVKSARHIPERKAEKFKGRPVFDRVVISVDPATGEKMGKGGADTHGIIAEGIRWEEDDGLPHAYVLEDLSIQHPSPDVYAKRAVDAYHRWKSWAPEDESFILAEGNTGGSHVRSVIRHQDRDVPVRLVKAGRGMGGSKADRAAPVASLALAGIVHMVGILEALEKQLARFTGAEGGHGRDDRADAFAWPIFKYISRMDAVRGIHGDDKEEEEQEEEKE